MSSYQGDDDAAEYMEDVDDEMEDVEVDVGDEFRCGNFDDDDLAASEEFDYSVCKVTQKEGHFYDFWRNSRSVKSTILHFQLRNLVWATSKRNKHPRSLLEGFTQTQVSTFAVKDDFLVAGGFQGELICKHLDRPGVSFCSRTTYDDNAITNAIEIYNKPMFFPRLFLKRST
ncbi:hypothetical protein F2Q69_00038545 [Brassica cretica]|uniref:Uncharacterized protein n=1 Tax=Brassica cretica TaxID=69181 RepID=A0A8S9SN30_BRACR|nr:hypothetical protein F2Q69_00038545 [Brassica cretica]